MDTRRSFLKKIFGTGLLAAGFGSGKISAEPSLSSNSSYQSGNLSSNDKIDLSYVIKKLHFKEELSVDECQVLFDYYVSVWYEFNFPAGYSNAGFYQKKKIIKEKLDEQGYNFIMGILYMGISRSNFYSENGFVLKPVFEIMLQNLNIEKGLLKKNFLEDLRILFLLMRDRYYSVLVKKYLFENLGSLLGDVDSEINWFNNKINEIKYSSLRVFMNDKGVNYKDYPKLIEKKIIDYIYSKEDSDKLLLRLLRHVNKKGLELSDINIHKLSEITKFSINSVSLNPQLREKIDKLSNKLNVNSKLVNLLCLIETSYGYGSSTSHAGARGPIQVMPKTYERFTKKKNFSSASDDELIEAGILNLINFMQELDINIYGTHPFSYIDLFMIGVSYNAGKDSLYKLVRKKDFKLTLEPINYHQFLYFLYSGIVEFK